MYDSVCDDAGRQRRPCPERDRRTSKQAWLCPECQALADAAEEQAGRMDDPDSDETPEERPLDVRLAEGFAMLNADGAS